MNIDMNEVSSRVYVGGWSASEQAGSQFDVVVNCGVDAPHFQGHHFNLVDGPGNSSEEMQAAIACVETAIRQGKSILVHCVAGKSRSVVVVAMALSRITGSPMAEIISQIAAIRGCEGPKQPHPALVELATRPIQ